MVIFPIEINGMDVPHKHINTNTAVCVFVCVCFLKRFPTKHNPLLDYEQIAHTVKEVKSLSQQTKNAS